VGEAWLGAHGFQYAGSIGPWPVSDVALATITRIGRVIAEAFELLGLFGVDLVIDEDKVWTIEVNPRYTASVEIVERAMGICAVALHAAACTEGLGVGDSELGISGRRAVQPLVSSPQSPAHGKAILFAKREITVPKQFAERALAESLRTPWPTLADIPTAGVLIEAGRPILTVFADGGSPDEVANRLRDRVRALELEIYGSK
jgi:predicted ATP-grasp superfamily ATP-dependent carboligase